VLLSSLTRGPVDVVGEGAAKLGAATKQIARIEARKQAINDKRRMSMFSERRLRSNSSRRKEN